MDQSLFEQIFGGKAAGRKGRGRAERKESFLAEALDEKAGPAAFAMANLEIDILLAEVGRFIGAIGVSGMPRY